MTSRRSTHMVGLIPSVLVLKFYRLSSQQAHPNLIIVLDQGFVALVVLNIKEAEMHDDFTPIDTHCWPCLAVVPKLETAMTLAMSPTVVASLARTGACGTETGTADDTLGARGRERKMDLCSWTPDPHIPLVLGTPCGGHNTTVRRLTCLREWGGR